MGVNGPLKSVGLCKQSFKDPGGDTNIDPTNLVLLNPQQ